MERRVSTLARVAALYLMFGVGCTGDGCSCMTAVPGGFPADQRMQNGVQLRLSDTGLAFIGERADSLAGQLLGDSKHIRFDVPTSCGSDPKVCCYVPAGYCQMDVDLERRSWDSPRFEVDMLDNGHLALMLRARINTTVAMPVHTYGPLGGQISCYVSVDSTWSGTPHVNLWAELAFEQDPDTGTTGVRVVATDAWGLSGSDVSIGGGFLCGWGSTTDAAAQVMGQFRNQLSGAVDGFLCQTCSVSDDCAPFGSCNNEGVCELPNGSCIQSFGTSGRIAAAAALPNLVTSRSGAMDIYLAAGGYARGEQGGVTLGVLAGARPGVGADRHACVPSVAAPVPAGATPSPTLATNRHPVTDESFDLGLAIHTDYLNHAAWAAHQAGFLCIDLGTEQVPLLTANALALIAPSFTDLVHDNEDPPVYILIRPQQPPTISLGAGTYVDTEGGGQTVDDPLLSIDMPNLEMDFYGFVDGRYVRLFTMIADLVVGANVDVDGDGKLVPVLGDLADAFGNIRVKNSGLLAEPPDDIAAKLPALLSIGLPAITDALGDIALPELAGFTLSLRPGSLTALDDNTSLGIFGDLMEAAPAERRLTAITTARLVRSRDTRSGQVTVALGGTAHDGRRADLEWQYRVDYGLWSPYTRSDRVTIRRAGLRVPGLHTIDVRARLRGEPRTTDVAPLRLEVVVPKAPAPPPAVVGFHGSGDGNSGCGCASSGDAPTGGGLLLLLGCAAALLRRRRVAAVRGAHAGGIALAVALCLLVGCGNGAAGDDEPDATPEPTAVVPGPTGRYLSMAVDGDRAVVVAYEQKHGDLVAAELDGAGGELAFRVLDGIPDEPPAFDPSGYRSGVLGPGPDVGAWTSAALIAGDLVAAYQDRDGGALLFGRETAAGWQPHVVDGDTEALATGAYASLVVDAQGHPAIAYRSVSADGKTSQLRWAQASVPAPTSNADWQITTIDEVSLDQLPDVHDVDLGTGLYVNPVFLPDGRAGVAFYRQSDHGLWLASRGDDGWSLSPLDVAPDTDRGQFAAALVDGDTLHVAYHDAFGHQLRLLHYRDGSVESSEIVDDGAREDGRPHSVGNAIRMTAAADGSLVIVYQDATTSDLLAATRSGDEAWTHSVLLGGSVGYGFYNAVGTTSSAVRFATYVYDQSRRVRGHVESGTM